MGHTIGREEDIEFDLESGENTSEEDAENDYVSNRESKGAFEWTWNGIMNLEGFEKGKSGVESSSNSIKPDDDEIIGLVQQQLSHVNGNHAKQKIKPFNPQKSPKPPLPPTGPSLDAGDKKFVKQLADLALKRRARVKKMKAVKKMKMSKSLSSSTYTNLSAMVITIIFFLVIIIHGIKSASSADVGLMTSHETTFITNECLVSVQYPTNINTNERDSTSFCYPFPQER